jgi:hypothetical protein
LAKESIDRSEIRMIEDIESFGAELQLQPLIDREIPPNRQIHLPHTEAASKVSRRVTRARSWSSEGRRINCPTSRASLAWLKSSNRLKRSSAIGTVQVDWLAGDEVESPIEELPIRLQQLISVKSYWEIRPRSEAVINTPVMQDRV